ncbi:MAG TPA: hypothetical protein VGU45_01120 [Microvirga sp.]|jgi:hypothetical protein|nr:hypothetical protein [Microvirga sp.]
MATAFNAKLAVYGQWTYRVAWALEIVAASIGLATGLVLGYQAYASSHGSDESISSVDLALASAPFLMVALAELIKIPIATLLFSVSWLWKPVLTICLGLLALITFETVFLGLERASTLRGLRYEEIQARRDTTAADLQRVRNAIAQGAQLNHVADTQAEFDRINAMADADTVRKRSEIEQVQSQIDRLRLQNPQVASLQRQLALKEAELKQTIDRRETELATVMLPFERQRDSYVRRIEEARRTSDFNSVRRFEDELARLRNPQPTIMDRFAPEVQRLEADQRNIRSQQLALEANESEAEKLARSELQNRRLAIEQELRELERSWQQRRVVTTDQLELAQRQQLQTASRIEDFRKQEADLSGTLLSIERERVGVARGDQVRRLASRIYGKPPEAVDQAEADFIALIWFGSLGALAALAGPLTAIVALGLQRTAEVRDQESKRPLSDYLRRWLIMWRWRRTRKVEVRIEVPVDREVEKLVEVPVEKVIKEILYVPILTDDPEVVRRTLQKDLPAEIADLVQAKFREPRSASAA